MNIRPIDLQVMIPRATDAAKVAALNERQAVTQQQQLAEHAKQTANEKQHQVQTAAASHPSGKVTTEDLNQEKRQEHSQQGEKGEKKTKEGSEEDVVPKSHAAAPPDPIRGHKIDIKT